MIGGDGKKFGINVTPIETDFDLEKILKLYPDFRSFLEIKTKPNLDAELNAKIDAIASELCTKSDAYVKDQFRKFISYRNISEKTKEKLKRSSEREQKNAVKSIEKLISMYKNDLR